MNNYLLQIGEKKIFNWFVQNDLRYELQDVLSGKSQVRFGTIIQTIASYLKDGDKTSSAIEDTKHFKREETKRLEEFITENNFWIDGIDLSKYVSEGAEQKVYLKDTDHVLKLNDSIYYTSWKDYLYNLLFHNYFFPDTAYNLTGFIKDNNILYAVVQQSYVAITVTTDLNQVKKFLTSNGFKNTRNNDYHNAELRIILEDLHDENVLTRNGILYFIDTVFYLTGNFWLPKIIVDSDQIKYFFILITKVYRKYNYPYFFYGVNFGALQF